MSCNVSSRAPCEGPGARVRARSRRLRGRPRALAAHALLAASCSWLAVAPAGADTARQAPPTIAGDEIFLDLKTRRFSAPIRIDSSSTVKVAVHAPTDSQVVLAYWESKKSPCPDPAVSPNAAPPTAASAGVVYRAGSPQEAAGEVQKYVIHVGPLKLLEAYCFHATVSQQKQLTASEQGHIDRAITQAIEAVMTTEALAIPSCSPPGDTAAQSAPLPPANIEPSRLGEAFERSLGSWSGTLVVAPGTDVPVSIRAAFENLVQSTAEVYDLVNRALQGVYAERQTTMALVWTARCFRQEVEGWQGGGQAAYDPLVFLDPRAIPSSGTSVTFTQLLRRDDLKRIFRGNLLQDRQQFIKKVWEKKDDLRETEGDGRARDAFPDEDMERRFQRFLDLPALPSISIPRGAVIEIIRRVERAALQIGGSADDIASEAAKLGSLFPPEITSLTALTALPEFDEARVENARLVRIMATAAALRTFAGTLKTAREHQAALTGSPALALFKSQMQRVSRWVEQGEIQYSPTYVERFPLSVTADVGVGVAAFAVDRLDVFSFLGLSIYFSPVYKDEPLRGFDAGRRLSLIVGITLNQPSLNADVKVGGLLGDRMLLAGGGMRLNEYVRLELGTLFYRQAALNPLSSRAAFRVGLYAGLSLDLDVIGTVTGWFKTATSTR